MEDKRNTGIRGENQAVRFLAANGYTVLTTNYRSGRAEIDIIARKNEVLVFVEVKTRKNYKFGYPEAFLSEAQQERIHFAADDYREQIGWRGAVRFDIIAIITDGAELKIDHFEDAF